MFLELHIIQNFAPSCLNRDDTNAPKDCEFGGYRRARISSQCVKRSVRKYFGEHAKELGLEGHLASRSKLLLDRLVEGLVKEGKDPVACRDLVKYAIESKMTMDAEKTSVLLFLGEDEIERLTKELLKCWSELADAAHSRNAAAPAEGATDAKAKKKTAKEQKAEKKVGVPESVLAAFKALQKGTQAADIALFGRMVAELENMNVDAACQVAHAFSTHAVEMEMDFYTAVDDLLPKGETGAGMMGIVEFNSSCFYRYALLDTCQLTKNLGNDKGLAKAAVLGFIKASVYAIPTGKQNSMAAQNLPSFVRVVVKDEAPPLSLANAFLSPIKPGSGEDLALASIKALQNADARYKKMYGLQSAKLDLASSLYDDKAPSIPDVLKALSEVLPS